MACSGQWVRPDVLKQGNPLFMRVEGLDEEVSVEEAVARAVSCMKGYIVCPECDCAITEDKKPKHAKHHEKKGLGEPKYDPMTAEWYVKAGRAIADGKEAIAMYSMEGLALCTRTPHLSSFCLLSHSPCPPGGFLNGVGGILVCSNVSPEPAPSPSPPPMFEGGREARLSAGLSVEG